MLKLWSAGAKEVRTPLEAHSVRLTICWLVWSHWQHTNDLNQPPQISITFGLTCRKAAKLCRSHGIPRPLVNFIGLCSHTQGHNASWGRLHNVVGGRRIRPFVVHCTISPQNIDVQSGACYWLLLCGLLELHVLVGGDLNQSLTELVMRVRHIVS